MALRVAIEGGVAIIINMSGDLTFRDFKKAVILAEPLSVKVLLCKEHQRMH
jgi:hypothetical protein